MAAGPGGEATNLSMNSNELVAQEDAARLLAVSPRTLEAWRVSGGGPPFVRLSRRAIRYRRVDLEAWIAERVVSSTSELLPARRADRHE